MNTHSKWIKCEDELPEESEYVLCFNNKDDQFIGYFYYEDEKPEWSGWTPDSRGPYPATHWQHLPSPPEEKK